MQAPGMLRANAFILRASLSDAQATDDSRSAFAEAVGYFFTEDVAIAESTDPYPRALAIAAR
jgi:hypothetical protein